MERTVLVKKGNDFFKIPVGNSVFQFVEGTGENMIVSSRGEILCRNPKKIKEGKDYYCFKAPRINFCKGYQETSLSKKDKKFLVHKIVAEAFIENPRGYTEVEHINGNKCDNRVENLRWVEFLENNDNKPYPWKYIVVTELGTEKKYKFKKLESINIEMLPKLKRCKKSKRRISTILSRLQNGGGKFCGYYWTAEI